jgi:hypothetical protein
MLKVEGEDARMWYESACDKTQGGARGGRTGGRGCGLETSPLSLKELADAVRNAIREGECPRSGGVFLRQRLVLQL